MKPLMVFKNSGSFTKKESCPLSVLIYAKETLAPAEFNAITISLFSFVV
jgi:hypothetical protein